jgi:hypothetical protein
MPNRDGTGSNVRSPKPNGRKMVIGKEVVNNA